ncbi:hypothetical protein [Gordonia sp. (in: high G+C Gram-positive bacteria)]|uniref:hypothetical protein n=1 Tax=Gordonia sp. (in: high G+C Gram-positive bacteria) TaxID=84139 RepID=UPI0039E2E2DA
MDHGVRRRRDLLRRGFTPYEIKKALRSGALTTLRDGWYARTDADPDVARAVRLGGALSCVSALQKHGLWTPPGYGSLHVRGDKHHRGPHSCRGYGGHFPVTQALDDIPLALLCAARCCTREDWIVLADSAMNKNHWQIDDLRRLLPRVPWVVEEMLRHCDPGSQSGTETIARVRLRAAGYKVVVQPPVAAFRGHSDLRIGNLLIECDSREFHDGQRDYEYDRYRDRKALVDEWLTIRLTYANILFDWIDVLSDIQAITRADRHRVRKAGFADRK